jgi:hypothetical protein
MGSCVSVNKHSAVEGGMAVAEAAQLQQRLQSGDSEAEIAIL